MDRKRVNPRKLLVASVGVATLNYLPTACSSSSYVTVANLVLPPDASSHTRKDSGTDAAADAERKEAGVPPSPTVANLVLPGPPPQNPSR